MFIHNIDKVYDINLRLQELISQYNSISEGKSNVLMVSIKGKYQDETFVSAITVHALTELLRRINVLKDQLRSLGVYDKIID